jgi:hypothetical protein
MPPLPPVGHPYQRIRDVIELIADYDQWLVAVDPGGAHVGVSCFGRREQDDQHHIWDCFWSAEYTPLGFEDWLSEQMLAGQIDILVYEKWQLYPDKAKSLIGSEMETSQLIGVIKYVWRALAQVDTRWPGSPVELVGQPASIKDPIRGLLKKRRITSMAKLLRVPLDHAVDAELHGWHHVIHTLGDSAGVAVSDLLKTGEIH